MCLLYIMLGLTVIIQLFLVKISLNWLNLSCHNVLLKGEKVLILLNISSFRPHSLEELSIVWHWSWKQRASLYIRLRDTILWLSIKNLNSIINMNLMADEFNISMCLKLLVYVSLRHNHLSASTMLTRYFLLHHIFQHLVIFTFCQLLVSKLTLHALIYSYCFKLETQSWNVIIDSCLIRWKISVLPICPCSAKMRLLHVTF